MTRLFFVFAIIIFARGVATAETVIVRSGEHKEFTRLVIRLPDNAGWTLNQSARTLTLQVDHPEIQFDLSQVFSRISRNRLTGLTQKGPGSELVFKLGCTCQANSFIEQSGLLVVDIKDQKGRPTFRWQMSETPTNQRSYRFSNTEIQDAPIFENLVELTLPIGPEKRGNHTEAAGFDVPQNIASEISTKAINASEQRLLAQIRRATDQGLVDTRTPPVESRADAFYVELKGATPTPDRIDATGILPPISLSATTVFDRDLALISRLANSAQAESVCMNSEQVALHDWVENRSFSVEIGRRRTQLFGEFDKIDPVAALGLARAYLHFGFGAEALQVISLVSKPGQQSLILSAIAILLDNGELPVDNPFTDQSGCEGDVALWSFFATKRVPAEVNRNAIYMAFSRLPPHLRNFFGPPISQKFSKAGDIQMAQSILRIMERIGVEPGSGIELAKAGVAQFHGDTKTAELELLKSVESGSKYSAQALVELVESQYVNRQNIAPELPDLVAAYAFEYRNAEIGSVLRRAFALSLALNDRFEEAFAALQNIEERDGKPERRAALPPLLALISERADDVTFLWFSLGSATEFSQARLPAEIGNQVARRLLDLGFADQASLWVANSEDKETSLSRQLLQAEIALARLLPNRAITELMGLEGREVEKLRASALLRTGDYQQAGQMLVAAEEYDAAARGFWLAEEWEAVPGLAKAHYAGVVAESVQLQKDDLDVSLRLSLRNVCVQGMFFLSSRR